MTPAGLGLSIKTPGDVMVKIMVLVLIIIMEIGLLGVLSPFLKKSHLLETEKKLMIVIFGTVTFNLRARLFFYKILFH